MMSTSHGSFIWYDLMSTDAKAAEAFYRGVVGWRMQDAGLSGERGAVDRAGLHSHDIRHGLAIAGIGLGQIIGPRPRGQRFEAAALGPVDIIHPRLHGAVGVQGYAQRHFRGGLPGGRLQQRQLHVARPPAHRLVERGRRIDGRAIDVGDDLARLQKRSGGGDRMSKKNRTVQNGPEEVGTRAK